MIHGDRSGGGYRMLHCDGLERYNDKSTFTRWNMHEFFAGSGMVAYGLKGMFKPVWANDISRQKAAVYEANFGKDYFELGDIKNVNGAKLPDAHLSWASFRSHSHTRPLLAAWIPPIEPANERSWQGKLAQDKCASGSFAPLTFFISPSSK